MGDIFRTYVKQLPVIALCFSLFSGIVTLLPLQTQLDDLATHQAQQLSLTLANQLAKAVRDPLIHRDNLSLQVELDDLITVDGVLRTAVYDINQRLIAQARRSRGNSDGAYEQRSPVNIENATVGYVTVALEPEFMSDSFSRPVWLLIGIWLACTLLLVFIAYRLGNTLSSRLGQLIAQLPGDADGRDELATLEHRMEPLLAIPEQKSPSMRKQPAALLGIACRNLPRLEALLNREHFETLMGRFDRLIDRTLQLYGGQRLHGDHYNIYLEFLGSDQEDDQTMNAAYCASALLRVAAETLGSEGISVELAAAVSPAIRQRSGSTLLDELDQGQHLKSLRELLDKAANGEILLNRDSCQHPSVAEFELDPLTEGSALCRLVQLGEDNENLLTRQIAQLKNH
jgi:uncharacterized membrane protein affecting hemolysin expression